MRLKRHEAGGTVTLTLNRPDVRNALDVPLQEDLLEALTALAERDDVRVLVLRGEGSVFCAGADLGAMRASGAATAAENRVDAERLAALFHALAAFPAPTVAAVQGAALGGALGLVACTDLVVAQEGARFATPEVRVGIVPATISPYVLRRLGPGAGADLLLTGRRIEATEALALGLVHRVVPELEAGLSALLEELAQGGPQALRATKALLLAAAPLPEAAARAATVEALVAVRSGPEAAEGLSAFLEKRPPRWVQP